MSLLKSVLGQKLAPQLNGRKLLVRYFYRCLPHGLNPHSDLTIEPFFHLLRYTDLIERKKRISTQHGKLKEVVVMPPQRLGPDALFLLPSDASPAMLTTVSCTLEGNNKAKFIKDFKRLAPECFFTGTDVSADLKAKMSSMFEDLYKSAY